MSVTPSGSVSRPISWLHDLAELLPLGTIIMQPTNFAGGPLPVCYP